MTKEGGRGGESGLVVRFLLADVVSAQDIWSQKLRHSKQPQIPVN